MKKFIITSIVALCAFGLVAPAHAESVVSRAELVKQIQAQIALLQEKVIALQKMQTSLSATSGSTTPLTISLSDLREGMTSDDVKLLQIILASDPSLYPEGKVTGYYGSLTTKALKRLQKKHGLKETGKIDGSLRSILNKLINDSKLSVRDRGNGEKKFCVPYGHLVAPGWKKNHGNRYVEECDDDLPYGIGKKATTTIPTATTTDSVAPGFLFVETTGRTIDSAVVTFGATEKVRARVLYATSSPHIDTAPSAVIRTNLAFDHSVLLSGLASGTPYYVKVVITDMSGNTATSSLRTFTTLTAGDSVAPVATSITVSEIASSSALLSWTTNEPARSKIYFGSTSPLVLASASSVESGVYSVVHQMKISGLPSATKIYFVIESEDVRGNKGVSLEQNFITLPNDTTPPVFSSVNASAVGTSTATVIVLTDEPSRVAIHYGASVPLSLATAQSLFDETLTTIHSFSLSGLSASTTYQYVASSRDVVGNRATSTEQSFTTLP